MDGLQHLIDGSIKQSEVSTWQQAKNQHYNAIGLFCLRWFLKYFKLKYRRSMLGVLWSVLNPLLMMIVLSAVFSTFFRFDIENFPLYLILGSTLFTLYVRLHHYRDEFNH